MTARESASLGDEVTIWRQFPYRYHAAALQDGRGASYRLTVEGLSDGRWEWLAWSAAHPTHCRYGQASSVAEARRAAEMAGLGLILEQGARLLPEPHSFVYAPAPDPGRLLA
jgi:hypothetical protein